MISMKAKVT